MKSIADHHRREEARALAALSADERVALAFQLGDDDLEIYRQARDLSHEEARGALRRARQAGRVRCACFEDLE